MSARLDEFWRQQARTRHLAMLRETMIMLLRDGLTPEMRKHAETVLDATTEHQRDQIGRAPAKERTMRHDA